MMEIKELIAFGMSPAEAQVFNEVLRFGRISIGSLLKQVELHRATIYDSLRKLIADGFVSFVEEGKTKYYRPNINAFENFLNEKKGEYKKEMETLEKIKESLKSKANTGEQSVQTFLGTKAFKILFYGMYEYCIKNDIEYLYLGHGGNMSEIIGEKEYIKTQKLKKKLHVKCRIILAEESKKLKYSKHVYGNRRYLGSYVESPVDFWVYGNTVMITLWKANPLITISIKSRNLALSLKNYFEILWKMAKS